jgi:prevent-host-death family protein
MDFSLTTGCDPHPHLCLFLDIPSNMANSPNIMKTFNAAVDPLLSALPAFDASTVKNKFRDVTKQAAKGAIAISRYSRPELVMMTAEEYVRLEKLRRAPLDTLTGQFAELVAKMQTAKSKKAVQRFFEASPSDLGKAAVKAAKANAR